MTWKFRAPFFFFFLFFFKIFFFKPFCFKSSTHRRKQEALLTLTFQNMYYIGAFTE